MKKTSKLCKKRKIFKWKIVCFTVTPLAGVWVEIDADCLGSKNITSHSPCGSVG